MSPSPEELEIGARAAMQVRFYEAARYEIRKTPWIYVILAGLLFLALILETNPRWPRDLLLFLVIPSVYIGLRWQNHVAGENYASNKLLLKLLEEKYGDALPWVVEEKQLASARELEAKIAQAQYPASHA